MKVHDISLPLRPELSGWPGDRPVASTFTWHQNRGDTVTVGAFEMSVHTGTHVDAPFHVSGSGLTADALPLEAFIGPATVINVAGHEMVTVDVLEAVGVRPQPRLLLRTGAWPDPARFPDRIPVLAPEVPEYLAARGVVLLGVDLPSVDALNDASVPNHHALFRRGIQILEGLRLEGVPEGDYFLSALPLPLAGMDGAPARAVLVEWSGPGAG